MLFGVFQYKKQMNLFMFLQVLSLTFNVLIIQKRYYIYVIRIKRSGNETTADPKIKIRSNLILKVQNQR